MASIASKWFKAIHEAARPARLRLHAVAGRMTPDNIRVGDFEIDCATRKVTVRGKELSLTPEEFDVLVFLAGHTKSVVTPRTLLNSEYGGHELHQAEFLQVLLSLRKRLEEAVGGRYIRTEPWVFYRFDASAG